MKDGHVTPHDSRWNKNLSINTVVATEVFARSRSAIFPRIPEQRVDRTMRQSDSLTAVCIDSYFNVDTWIVPGCDDGRQQVGMPSF